MNVQERAYLLWETDGRPESDGKDYWNRAERQLRQTSRKVRSGELSVEGFGTLDEVVDLALTTAVEARLGLGEEIEVIDTESNDKVYIPTLPKLTTLYPVNRD